MKLSSARIGIGIEASEQTDDRALSDAAGSQERGYDNFGGTAQFYQPRPDDTSSVYATAKGIFGAPNVEVIDALRLIKGSYEPVEAGDEFHYVMHALTDAQQYGRDNQPGIYYSATLLSQSDVLAGYIVPDGTTKVLATVNDAAPSVDGLVFAKATYFDIDVTKQVEWVSSDEDVLRVIAPGIAMAVGNGTADLTATYPDNAATASTVVSITVA